MQQQYGGKTAKGTLVAGPIQQTNSRYTYDYVVPEREVVNHASTVADYDFGVFEEQKGNKFETYSH